MTLGIECLLTDDAARAAELARTLDAINRERRSIEGDMRDHAMLVAESLCDADAVPPAAVCVYDESFHEGVVGIVASRLKDKLHRPTFVFASARANRANARARAAPSRASTCATRWTSWPSAILACCCASAATPWPPAAPLSRTAGTSSTKACARSRANGLDEAALTRRLDTDGPLDAAYRRA